ncbi:hypothetical protein FRC20_006484 [Serendipita sp. 405]|nr:hypothetical protein FRC20_006484 [Serendipita sp. 405]
MTEPQTGDLNRSRVVHISVDPTINFEVPKPIRKQRESDEEAGEGNEDDDSDREITNSRPCMDSDGLLNVEELCSFIGSSPIIPLRSAYGDVLGLGAEGVETHGQRTQKTDERKGTHEPAYTSYTHFWKNTLDYIFFSTPDNCQATVEAILKPHRTEDMGDGLPKQDICGSDHISLAAKITFITDPKERR